MKPLAVELREVADTLRASGLDKLAAVCDRATLRLTLDAIEIANLKRPVHTLDIDRPD